MRSGLVSRIKGKFIGGGRKPYVVPLGLYRDITLELDLRSDFQLYSGMWEIETHHYLNKWSDYTWAIDVGAGGGELCLFLLKHKPHLQQLFAVEPDRAEVHRMRLNFRGNPDLDTGRITIVESRAGTGAGAAANKWSLDELKTARGPGLIKIDVDGFEIEVLKGATKLLGSGTIDLLLETHSLALEQDSIEFLKRLGFATTLIKNGWYRRFIPEQRPSDHNRWLWASSRGKSQRRYKG